MWGADQEGGGPFIYPKEDDPDTLVGFEVDLAKKLGEYLKVKDEFSQGQWDTLLDLLQANKVQVVLNGYEWSPERAVQRHHSPRHVGGDAQRQAEATTVGGHAIGLYLMRCGWSASVPNRRWRSAS